MRMFNPKIVFLFCFTIYQIWGAYWVGICVYPIAEECISASWVLLFSGLPLTLTTIGFGGVGIPDIILKSIIGGLNFGLIFMGALFYLKRKRKIANKKINRTE